MGPWICEARLASGVQSILPSMQPCTPTHHPEGMHGPGNASAVNTRKLQLVSPMSDSRNCKILCSEPPGLGILERSQHRGTAVYRLCALSLLKFPLYETEAYVYQDTDIFPPAGKLAHCILFYNKQKRQLKLLKHC